MQDLASTLWRLRAVKRAGRRFLALHAADSLLGRPEPIDRLVDDVERSGDDGDMIVAWDRTDTNVCPTEE
jgi:hypothetical protein